MMGLRTQSININRMNLMAKLKLGLEAHQLEYKEAMREYADAVVCFMREACARAEAGDFTDLVLVFQKPQNHATEISNVIELLNESVDENINLDSAAFRAYVKGEWDWKHQFDLGKQAISGYLATRSQ